MDRSSPSARSLRVIVATLGVAVVGLVVFGVVRHTEGGAPSAGAEVATPAPARPVSRPSPLPPDRDDTPNADGEVRRLARTLPASSGSLPPGLWNVRGDTISSQGFDDDQGRVLRRWRISRDCSPSCGLWIARETSAGVERARLTTRRGRWFATFHRRTDGCGTARTGRSRRAFAFSVTPDQRHIRALEINRAVFPACRETSDHRRADMHAVATVVWEATLTGRECDRSGCRVRIPDVGAREPDTPYLAEQRRAGLATCRRTGRSAAQCLCTLRRVLTWTPASIIALRMEALDHGRKVDRIATRQVRRDADACA